MNKKKALFLGLGTLIIDFFTKRWVFYRLLQETPIFHFWGIDFSLQYVANHGIAWGAANSWGSGWHLFILIVRIIVIASLFVSLWFATQKGAIASIIAGGIGNIVDYFIYGHVVDMFHFVFWGYSFPVFNVADTAICLGVLSLIFAKKKKSR